MKLPNVIKAIELENHAREIEAITLCHDVEKILAAKPHKHAAMMKAHDHVRNTSEKIYKTAIDKVLADAEAEVLGNLHAHNSKINGRNQNTTRIQAANPTATTLNFDLDGFTTKFLSAINTAGRQAYLFTSKGLLSELGQNETATDAGVVRDFLIKRQNKISGCPKIIFDQIQQSLDEGVANGETMPELADRVQEAFDGISKTRATLIASTESQAAYGNAQFNALDTAGIERKLWISMEDSLVRPTHAAAADEGPVNSDEEFVNGLLYPGDIDGDAAEVCNCRCYLAPVEKSEDDLADELSELEEALS